MQLQLIKLLIHDQPDKPDKLDKPKSTLEKLELFADVNRFFQRSRLQE